MDERLRKFALVAEIVGGIAVLITLIVLVLEISQSTRAMRAQTAQDVWTQLIQFGDYISSDPGRVEVFSQLSPELENLDALGPSVYPVVRRLMYVYDNAYYQYQQGTLDDDVFSRYRFGIEDWVAREWFPQYWDAEERFFSRSYITHVEALMSQ